MTLQHISSLQKEEGCSNLGIQKCTCGRKCVNERLLVLGAEMNSAMKDNLKNKSTVASH